MRHMRFFMHSALIFMVLCAPVRVFAEDSEHRRVVLYTSFTATTPQIPLWAAIHGGWPENRELSAEYWKTLDDLRGMVLAGKGDIWVGHLEGFAQAALRGAPIRLVAVTGWEKFYFIGPETSPPSDLTALALALRQAGLPLAAAPPDSPAIAVLEAVNQRGGPSFAIAAMPPQQLMLDMARGRVSHGLLPEPLVSMLLARQPRLRVLAGLEAEYARLYGGFSRFPWVGVAVNSRFAEQEPESIRKLAAAMQAHAIRLADDPEAAIAALPPVIRKEVGEDILRASLPRDRILVIPATDAAAEIRAFLPMVLPETDPARLDALLSGPFLFGNKQDITRKHALCD